MMEEPRALSNSAGKKGGVGGRIGRRGGKREKAGS